MTPVSLMTASCIHADVQFETLELAKDICNGYLYGTWFRREKLTEIMAEREMEHEFLEPWNGHVAKGHDYGIDV